MIEAVIGVLGLVSVGSLGWAYNLGTKVSALEQSTEDFKEFMEKILDAKLNPINQRLDRMERSMSGKLRGH